MRLLFVLCLLGCGEQCRVLADKVVTPVRAWNCTVAGVTVRITGAGPLDDVSSSAGPVYCAELALP